MAVQTFANGNLGSGIGASATSYPPSQDTKGTAVDSVNANLESITNRIEMLTRFAVRVTDGLIGSSMEKSSDGSAGPRPVAMSTQDHLRALEGAFDRLAGQINRLG